MILPTAGSLALTRCGYSNATLSGNGLRSANMTLAGDNGKTVVYTDREVSRTVLEHFDTFRDAADMTRLALADDQLMLPTDGIPHVETALASTRWRINHGVPSNMATVDNALPATAENPKRANSYTGYLYGQSGSFGCGSAPGSTATSRSRPTTPIL